MGIPASLTLGPMFMGLMFNIFLYGVMVTQMFIYYNTYKKDRLWIKCFVGFLLFADTLNSAFDIAFVYIPLVTDFGNTYDLAFSSWLFATAPAMTVFIAMTVQIFFAWRIKVLTGNVYIFWFIVLCAICEVCGGLGTSIAIGIVPEYIQFQKFESIVIVWIVGALVADIAITISLVWSLRAHRNGIPSTADRLNKIIRLTVQTGLVTTVVEITHLILFLSDDTAVHLVFSIPIPKLYTNTVLSSLNSRTGWTSGTAAGGGSLPSHNKTGSLRFTTGPTESVPEMFVDIDAHALGKKASSDNPIKRVSNSESPGSSDSPWELRSIDGIR